MRISDWSSDVCSSDLTAQGGASIQGHYHKRLQTGMNCFRVLTRRPVQKTVAVESFLVTVDLGHQQIKQPRQILLLLLKVFQIAVIRSDERRVGKECVSTCRYRWSPCH